MHLTRRTHASGASVALAAVALTMLVPTTAHAAEGAAPVSKTRQVISNVHADFISPFLDDGILTLGTKADIGGLGQRFDPEETVLNVEEASKIQIPDIPAYSFLGPAGSDTWIAPEVQQQGVVWPGFSTESIPVGALDGNTIDIELTDFSGPGELEVWDSSGAFGAPGRIFSSRADSGLSNRYTFNVPQHKHVNWGFSAPGSYQLTFTATASAAGAPQSTTQTYSVVVGDLAQPVATTIGLAASPTALVVGESVALEATVTPADAVGAVEFFDGSTVLGHAEIAGGVATLAAALDTLGDRSITASFVPSWTNDFAASTSTAQTVRVTEAGEEEVFSIAGVEASYLSGETMTAKVVGATLQSGQSYRWSIRETGGTAAARIMADYPDGTAAQGTMVRPLNTFYNGYEISAELRGTDDSGTEVTLQQTPWVPLTVTGENHGTGRDIRITGLADSYLSGDLIQVGVDAATQLGEGESYRWVYRGIRSVKDWAAPYALYAPVESGEGRYTFTSGITFLWEWALQAVDADGEVLGQSAPIVINTLKRELQLSGAQSFYRVGDTISIESSLHPALADVTYQWKLGDTAIDGETESGISIPATAEMNGQTLTLESYRDNGLPTDEGNTLNLVTLASVELKVSEAANGEQVAFFSSLNEHYHQGNPVKLSVTLEPAATDSDTVEFSWKRPDQTTFTVIPGTTGFSHTITAEQALNGTQVHAVVKNSAGEVLAETEQDVTIYVDDHGAAARQLVSVSGVAAGYAEGAQADLTAQVAYGTALTRYQWFVKKAGARDAIPVAGANGAAYSFPVTSELDGAAVSAAVVFDDGSIAYGPSTPVTIAVTEATVPTVFFTSWPEQITDGEAFTISAASSPTIEGSSYLWEAQLPNTSAWVQVAGPDGVYPTGPEFAAVGSTHFDGVLLRVSLVSADGAVVAVSEPRELRVITVIPTEPGLYAIGAAGHYHSNDPITLTATTVPENSADASYRWYTKRSDQTDYVPVSGQTGAGFRATAEQALDGALIRVERLDAEGHVVGASEPVTLVVDDHGAAPVQAVTVSRSADRYAVGADVSLTATVAPASVLTRWVWFVQPTGSGEATEIEGQNGAEYTFPATIDLNGAAVFARLTFDDGRSYVQSEPVTLAVTEAGEPGTNDPDPGEPGVVEGDGSTDGSNSTSGPDLSSPAADQLSSTGLSVMNGTIAAGLLLLLGVGAVLLRRRSRRESA
jgi:surface-anchored protein